MEGSILELLELHESLAFDQIVMGLGEPPDAVRNALADLSDSGFISVLRIGEIQGQMTAASYWRLTDRGRDELARRRSG